MKKNRFLICLLIIFLVIQSCVSVYASDDYLTDEDFITWAEENGYDLTAESYTLYIFNLTVEDDSDATIIGSTVANDDETFSSLSDEETEAVKELLEEYIGLSFDTFTVTGTDEVLGLQYIDVSASTEETITYESLSVTISEIYEFVIEDMELKYTVLSSDVSTTISFSAVKELEDQSGSGRTLEADEFSFQITDDEGNVLATGTNDEDGVISFSSIDYEDDLTVYISEIAGDDEHIVYDDTVITVSIVEEDGSYSLSVE